MIWSFEVPELRSLPKIHVGQTDEFLGPILVIPLPGRPLLCRTQESCCSGMELQFGHARIHAAVSHKAPMSAFLNDPPLVHD